MVKTIEAYKELFIFVAGTTPQIITETIYALSQKKPAIYPHEIFIITTLTGKKVIKKSLIDNGILKEMSFDLGIQKIPITEESFVIPKDRYNKEIDDIRNEQENELMGNLITSFIREKVDDPSTRLHCSIAGGRKTMSFYLGAALQLFGRPQDRLYHVLVTPEFESNPEFFYKPKKNRVIEGKGPDGRPITLNTDDAMIELAELPFIRLSRKISFKEKDFTDLVNEGQRTIDTAILQPELIINLSERYIQIGSNIIDMLPNLIVFYNIFLKQKLNHCIHPERNYCKECIDCFVTIKSGLTSREYVEEMAHDHSIVYKNSPMRTEEFIRKWKDGMSAELIRQNISKINKSINEHLDDETLKPLYRISCIKRYSESLYGIRVEKTKIKIG